jgi:hypothetical protein
MKLKLGLIIENEKRKLDLGFGWGMRFESVGRICRFVGL